MTAQMLLNPRAGRRASSLSLVLLLAAAAATLSGLEGLFVGSHGVRTRLGSLTLNFKNGDAVEANYGDGNWYSAVVQAKNKDGTFTVKWDDSAGGPETAEVKEEDIKEYVPPIPLSQLVVGSKHKGKVVSVAGFGAFVNFGAEKDGLVHVSCLQDGFVANVNDVVSEGQEVTVWVKGVNDGKVSLTMVESKLGSGGGGPRAPRDITPFQSLVGESLPGKVVSVTGFGAFVEMQHPSSSATAQGLVHVSELSDGYVADPNDVVKVGQEVRVRVKDVNMGTGKISLSMKS